MSRWLYTISVVSRPLAEELKDLLTEDDAQVLSRRFEIFVTSAVSEGTRDIISFASFMDGWCAAHKKFSQKSCNEEFQSILSGLNNAGVAICQFQEAAVLNTDRSAVMTTSELDMIGTRLFATCLNEAVMFSVSTRCPTVVTVRCLGPSYDDSEYR